MEVYRDISLQSEKRNDNKNWYEPSQEFFLLNDININAIFNSIYNIFTWIQGERILNPDFGSKLHTYLYEGITEENKEAIAAEIRGVCVKYEPRINVVDIIPVNDIDDQENNTVRLDIKFEIPGLTDEQFRYSYTFNRNS
jgi:phage baseplate assembly protein W